MFTRTKIGPVPEVGAEAPEFNLPSAQGGQLRLSMRTPRGPVVVAFYRPGDEEDVEYFKAMAAKEDEINLAAGSVVAIGVAEPYQAQNFGASGAEVLRATITPRLRAASGGYWRRTETGRLRPYCCIRRRARPQNRPLLGRPEAGTRGDTGEVSEISGLPKPPEEPEEDGKRGRRAARSQRRCRPRRRRR